MYKKGSQKYLILKCMQDKHSESFLVSDFMGWKLFRKAPFVWYSAQCQLSRLKKSGYITEAGKITPTVKLFSKIWRAKTMYTITPKWLNVELW